MAATQSQTPDRTIEEQSAEANSMKEQVVSLSAKIESSIAPNSSQATINIGHTRDVVAQSGSFGSNGDRSVYPSNIYAPQAQAFYYRGYENVTGEWDEYSPYVNAEGLELGSAGIYNENPSLVFHTGYGYSPQMPYGPYSPVTSPSIGGEAHLYSPQQFPFSGPPYYQQMVPHSVPYITSPTPVSQPELSPLISADQQNDSMPFGPRPGYPPQPLGSFGRGSIPGNPNVVGFHDLQQGFDGLRSGGLWSDWSKPSDRQRTLPPISPAVSPQPIGSFGSFGQNVSMGTQQQRSFPGFGSGSNSYNRGFIHGGFDQGSSFGASSISSLGMNGRGWISFENSKRRGRGAGSLCGCNGNLDILSEQNRGPRAAKPKSQMIDEHGTPADSNKNTKPSVKILEESYNRPDFVTEYKEAKFFIIKSYSEDNVHKSIKYGVWASTPNGNKKLDAAYREAKEKQDMCPVFLFFSVNASAQFCGVAEMTGPVDFEKSVDYWQQDKWSGQFPVKWHMIKDVPNSQFRHIVLENNDNKPVTNSRDTQEVKLEQGVEMLNIFKNYETEMSILDDFGFYEDRQKAMQERKARQQTSLMAVGVVGENDHRTAAAYSSDLIKQMSKSFAQVVRLEEGHKESNGTDRVTSAPDARTVVVSSAQTN